MLNAACRVTAQGSAGITSSMSNWSSYFKAWEQSLRVSDRSSETIRTWASYLRRWHMYCAAHELDEMRVDHWAVIGWLDEHDAWSASCKKSARSALRSFYRLAVTEGWAELNPMDRIGPVRQLPAVSRSATTEQLVDGLSSSTLDDRLMFELSIDVRATRRAPPRTASGIKLRQRRTRAQVILSLCSISWDTRASQRRRAMWVCLVNVCALLRVLLVQSSSSRAQAWASRATDSQ